MFQDSAKMSSNELNYLSKNGGPESPSILSVNPHVIPTVSAKMGLCHSSENVEWDPITASPMKELYDQLSPTKQIFKKKLPPQRSRTQETAVTTLSLEKDGHTEQ